MARNTISVMPLAEDASKVEPTGSGNEESATVRDFTERTTMHGCQSVTQPDYHVMRRLTWGILVLVCAGFFLSAFVNGVIQYQSYPSAISNDIQPLSQLALPDVTICNSNMFRRSFLEAQSPSIQSLFTGQFQNADLEDANATLAPEFYSEARDPLDTFITNCRIDSLPFICMNHIKVNFLFGAPNCYTFELASNPLNATARTSGLLFVVTLNDSENTGNGFGGVGVNLMFHQSGEIPPDNMQVSIPPQSNAYVAIQKSRIERLGTPYSTEDCHEEQNATFATSTLYSKRGCQMECYFDYFKHVVGCDWMGVVENLRDCSLYETMAYFKSAYDHMLSAECRCLRPCNETVFTADVTTLAHQDTLTPPTHPEIKRIAVTVYYPNLEEKIVRQRPSYGLLSLVADVGGQMGLFLGASILTLSEFFEFFLMFIWKKLKSEAK